MRTALETRPPTHADRPGRTIMRMTRMEIRRMGEDVMVRFRCREVEVAARRPCPK